MENVIKDIGERLRGMREILDISPREMASVTGVSEKTYLDYEAGLNDFSFTFLFKAAQYFGLDLTELITGESPHLTGYSLVRKGQGMLIERRKGFHYLNLAGLFRHRMAEPFLVSAPYEDGAENSDISLGTHAGQEMDYILSGTLRVRIDNHEEIMYEGDTIYYDSGRPHGMVAIGGMPCCFLAIVLKPESFSQEA